MRDLVQTPVLRRWQQPGQISPGAFVLCAGSPTLELYRVCRVFRPGALLPEEARHWAGKDVLELHRYDTRLRSTRGQLWRRQVPMGLGAGRRRQVPEIVYSAWGDDGILLGGFALDDRRVPHAVLQLVCSTPCFGLEAIGKESPDPDDESSEGSAGASSDSNDGSGETESSESGSDRSSDDGSGETESSEI